MTSSTEQTVPTTGPDRPSKIMAAVVGLALVGIVAAAVFFITTALLSPRPTL